MSPKIGIIFIVLALYLTKQSAGTHVAPLSHIILTPSQRYVVLTPKAVNNNCIFFDLYLRPQAAHAYVRGSFKNQMFVIYLFVCLVYFFFNFCFAWRNRFYCGVRVLASSVEDIESFLLWSQSACLQCGRHRIQLSPHKGKTCICCFYYIEHSIKEQEQRLVGSES